jgi:hypothetical protein
VAQELIGKCALMPPAGCLRVLVCSAGCLLCWTLAHFCCTRICGCAPAAGEFVITHPNVQVPPKGNIYSINEGNAVNWDAATKK